ncbi:MAG: hypothetical protein ACTHOI_13700 [Sphingomicrobium sp.]
MLAVTLALLWPAFVNGEPFYMPDTSSYLRGADAAAYHLTGRPSAWTGEYFKRYPSGLAPAATTPAPRAPSLDAPASSPAAGASTSPQSKGPPVVLTGRSVYYGLLLYASQWLGNFWSVAVFQALLVAVAIALTVSVFGRALGIKRDAISIALCGTLIAAFTSVGYFASYLLPDVFGALGLLAFGHLVFVWEQNSRLSRAYWCALLAMAMLFHLSNFLLVALLAITALLATLLKVPAARSGLAAVAAALMIAAAGQALFSWSVRHATGHPPIAPPFLAARIIADGPGYEYLREHCPQVRLIYCRAIGFNSRISDSLLWSTDQNEGIFQALTPAEQRMAAAQQAPFVLAVAKERPIELIGSSIGAFFRQLTYFRLESFNYTRGNVAYFETKIPSPFIEHARQSKAYHKLMPVRLVEWTTIAAVLLSLVAIFWTLRTMIRSKRVPPVGAFLLFMVIGALFNSVICGAISTPKGRYQMRLVWVLPLVALASRRLLPWEPVEWAEDSLSTAAEPKSVTAR